MMFLINQWEKHDAYHPHLLILGVSLSKGVGRVINLSIDWKAASFLSVLTGS